MIRLPLVMLETDWRQISLMFSGESEPALAYGFI